MKISIDYTWLGKVENEIRNSHYHLSDIQYADAVHLFVDVLQKDEETFTNWIIELTNGQSSIHCVDKKFVEFTI